MDVNRLRVNVPRTIWAFSVAMAVVQIGWGILLHGVGPSSTLALAVATAAWCLGLAWSATAGPPELVGVAVAIHRIAVVVGTCLIMGFIVLAGTWGALWGAQVSGFWVIAPVMTGLMHWVYAAIIEAAADMAPPVEAATPRPL